MFELFILIALVALVVIGLRPRKPVPEQPLVIEQPGRYHITLAPQLRSALAFLEDIAMLAAGHGPAGDTLTLFYQVLPVSLPRGSEGYLLALAWRGRMLYFQAIQPVPLPADEAGQLKLLREYSDAVLLHHPAAEPLDSDAQSGLRRAVAETAGRARLEVHELR